ncbi:hypothetical protein Tco_1112866 [Tanacetum coccineum]|uniref:Uncharacterized protein n=1 Tax=Tanacetum coccineum TaxID=301880 RepID=A0ABQ5IQI8_9ASTR
MALPRERFEFILPWLGMKSMKPETLKHLQDDKDESEESSGISNASLVDGSELLYYDESREWNDFIIPTLRVLRIILVILPEHPSDTKYSVRWKSARAIKQALGDSILYDKRSLREPKVNATNSENDTAYCHPALLLSFIFGLHKAVSHEYYMSAVQLSLMLSTDHKNLSGTSLRDSRFSVAQVDGCRTSRSYLVYDALTSLASAHNFLSQCP